MKARMLSLLATLFLAAKAMSQPPEPYAASWKKADSLLGRDLPQSARKIVDKVYSDAQRTGQPVQMLKAQLYLMRLDESGENADSLHIARAEEQIRKTAFPVNALWQSIAAQLYWNHYQQNRYVILQRTRTTEAVGTDFEQWDAAKFAERSSALYLQSIARAEDLKRINIEAYDPVLIKGENTRSLRPMLFDLLAFRAIDFFENDEKDLTRPAFQFVMDDAAAFAPANEFVQHRFKTQDTASMQYRALTLYQEILAKQDNSWDALIDADLKRAAFAYNHSVHPDKKTLYRALLERMEKDYAPSPLSAIASFRLAELMMAPDATQDDEDDDIPRRDAARASPDLRAVKTKLEAIIAKFPNSEGGASAKNLLQSIAAPSLAITAEEAVLPDAPSRVLLTYKNVPRVYIRVVKMNPDDYREEGRYNNDNYIKKLLAATPLQSFSAALPGTEDYAGHNTEVKIDALPLGMYAVIVSAKESFPQKDNAMSFAVTQSTRLAVITQNSSTSKALASGYVLDRKEGTPVAKAILTFFSQRYNNSTNRYDYVRAATTTTAADGSFRVSGADRSYNGMMIAAGVDAFYTTEYLNFYRYERQKSETERTFFFTDRSIYRPGQTIYFKGILTHTDADGRTTNVVAGRETEVTFYDVNSQKIASQKATTNEWGSFTGSFTAPQGGLTGQMRIEGFNGNAYISVEEYKRPKFRVDWDTLKGDYALGEQVAVTGHALAYAGNNVDGATVKYRVTREARWPSWWYYWRFGGKSSPQQEIAQGTATTDAGGKFIIRFQALPDRSIDERSLPVFTYTVHADVTDLNGETRSGTKSVTAGYRSLQIVADLPEQASRKDLDTVHITTKNLNGDFVAASVNIKVARLQQPDVVYRKRLWATPDQFTMSEAEFRKSFPLDAYKDEDDYRNWKEAEQTFSRSLTTTRDGNVSLPATAFTRNSWYVITISAKDKNGKAVEEKKFVQAYDGNVNGNSYAVLHVWPLVQSSSPGEPTAVGCETGVTDTVHVIRQVQTMDGNIKTSQLDLYGSNVKHLDLRSSAWVWDVTEADRGGIALSYITVKDNRVYTASARIDVPWTNKDLSIEWETHRDKLLPGEKEEWTMIVRGNKKDKVAAEMAAALYDASLDAFKPHAWGIGELFPSLDNELFWRTTTGFGESQGKEVSNFESPASAYYDKRYDALLFMENGGDLSIGGGRTGGMLYEHSYSTSIRAKSAAGMVMAFAAPAPSVAADGVKDERDREVSKPRHMILPEAVPPPPPPPPADDIPIRKALQETAFFYPQLHTDAEGAVRIQFTLPEALTEWKLLTFAHTKDMRSGVTTGTVKTQKDLMVQPGLPRFLRQGDEVSISTKIVNLSDKDMSGTATLEILDALTGKPLNNAFSAGLQLQQNFIFVNDFRVPKGGSTSASWKVHVPESRYEPVIIRISAKAGAFTDGEENTLPVLTNRALVTETLPLWMNGAGTKTFSFEKLLHSHDSSTFRHSNTPTLQHHRLTLEYTANPAWYAVQALPYLMEYPYECVEQTFNRYYANALAAHILDKAPRVKEIFRKWEEQAIALSPGGEQVKALASPLEKNEELKSALLEETPWVLDAQNETKQKHNIALLFRTAKLTRELDKTARKLEDMMLPEGGWPWFKGDTRPDRYITQYIVTGIGRLQHLGVDTRRNAPGGGAFRTMAERAIPYLDRKMEEDYRSLLRQKADMKARQISYFEVQYLYMRSFFRDIPPAGISVEATAFYKRQAQQFWPGFNPYVKGMMALALSRGGDGETPKVILQSLRETSIQKEETGMYWMEPGRSWYWWEAPVEAQSLLIECFGEVAQDNAAVDNMKRWLLKQKQTNAWPSTKATADACYALLLQGSQWLESAPQVTVQLGNASAPLSARTTIRSTDQKSEAGTGYFKVQYGNADIKPEMGNITLTVTQTDQRVNESTTQPSWGAVYWQYFENLDKITAAATPLVVKKRLFIERNTDHGIVLEPIAFPLGDERKRTRDSADGMGAGALHIGDKVTARIEIIADRDMEYVHLKDGRAACFEPVNVLSGYRWQGALGYYESTKDASSNFFFSFLPKGKYVFEYPMFVTNSGDYSAGLATIQCMYAPEFSAHSEGVRVVVK